MDPKVGEELLEELVPAIEALDTRSTAILQFLKEKGGATDEQLAPYLQQAASASSVRWRAIRLRIARLLSLAEKAAEQKAEQAAPQKPKKTEERSAEQKAEQAAPQNPQKTEERSAEPKAEQAVPQKPQKTEERSEKGRAAPEAPGPKPENSNARGKKHADGGQEREGEPPQKSVEQAQ